MYLQVSQEQSVYIIYDVFVGITGTVSIDDNGDRNADYSLLDMNPTTHKFEVSSYDQKKNPKNRIAFKKVRMNPRTHKFEVRLDKSQK